MKRPALLLLAALAAPAAAVTPARVEDALTPANLSFVAPAIAACLESWGVHVVITDAVLILPERRVVGMSLLHSNGARSDCRVEVGATPRIIGRSIWTPPHVAPSGDGRRIVAPRQRCPGARPVPAADGRPLVWFEDPPCR